jgi:tetratricopeptide (TPR) repeat protein
MALVKHTGAKKTPGNKAVSKKERLKNALPDFAGPLRELLMVRISREINRRDINQAEAAQILGVSQPRVSDLTRGLTSKFTIDALVEFAGLLGLRISIDVGESGHTQNLFAWLDASDDAIAYYTKCLSFNPADAESYWKRGHAYFRSRQYELAIGDYTRAMELDTNLQHLRINRAQAHTMLQQFSAARLDCEQFLSESTHPEHCAQAYASLANARTGPNQHALAMNDLEQAIRIAPNYASNYLARGWILERSGEYYAALADFAKVLELAPENVYAKDSHQKVSDLIRGKTFKGGKQEMKVSPAKQEFDRLFTVTAQKALLLARREAERSNRDVDGLHLLMGLLQEGQGVGGKNLKHLGVTEEALRTVRENSAVDPGRVNNFDQVLEEAYAEAVRLKHDFIGSEHLLLALLDSADAGPIFEQMQIVPSEAKTTLLRLLGF